MRSMRMQSVIAATAVSAALCASGAAFAQSTTSDEAHKTKEATKDAAQDTADAAKHAAKTVTKGTKKAASIIATPTPCDR